MPKVTMHDIAERANVSVATVSLALRGRGSISEKRGHAIRQLAKEMGYRPNPLLASLAAKQFSDAQQLEGTPLAIFSFPPEQPDGRPHNNLYHAALQQEARLLGYTTQLVEFPSATTPAALYRRLYNCGMQGIIITGSVDMDDFGRHFNWEAFTVVQCARYRFSHAFHTVRPNIVQAVTLAFNTVRERGYQRIGFALGRHHTQLEDDLDRHGAAYSLQQTYLPKKHHVPLHLAHFDDKEAYLTWFHKYRPEVVIGFGVGYYWWLVGEGLSIPDDVAFVTLHKMDCQQGNLTGVNQHNDLIARQSVQLLDQLFRNHQRGISEHSIHQLIPSTWHEGTTLPQST
jgi:LacI family transcriptional regulator